MEPIFIVWLVIGIAAVIFFIWRWFISKPKPVPLRTYKPADPTPLPIVNMPRRVRAGRIPPPPMRPLPTMRVPSTTLRKEISAPAPSRNDDSDFLTGALAGMLVNEIFHNHGENGRSCSRSDEPDFEPIKSGGSGDFGGGGATSSWDSDSSSDSGSSSDSSSDDTSN